MVTWLAAILAVGGSAMVTSRRQDLRRDGFACYIASNVLFMGWAIDPAVIAMSACFLVTSVVGLLNNWHWRQG